MVTGGSDSRSTVLVYTLSGAQGQLPSLQTGRWDHACAYYLDSQDRPVRIVYNLMMINIIIIIMVINN